MTRIWDKLKYVRIAHIANKVQARQQRRERANFLRFLMHSEHTELALRARAIKLDPRMTGEEKRVEFEKVLNDYAAKVVAKPVEGEAAPVQDGAGVGVPIVGPEADSVDSESLRRFDDDGGISELVSSEASV